MTPSVKVFGIGLSRTGTSSLNEALTSLGFASVHFPADRATRAAVARYLLHGAAFERLPVLDTAAALTDTPVCCIFRPLDAAYPDSKFVLTVREEQDWLRSCERHWARASRRPRQRTGLAIAARRARRRFSRDSVPDHWEYVALINDHIFGVDRSFDPDRLLARRASYESDVREHFNGRQENLLVLDICAGQGWPELCAFLGVPERSEPFPRTNVLADRKQSATVEA